MWLEQWDLFWQLSLLEKSLWWKDTRFDPVVILNSKYKRWKVHLIGILFHQNYKGKIVHVAQLEIFVPKQRNIRVNFSVDSQSLRVQIEGFSFWTNTHRDQEWTKSYSIDSMQMQEVLTEILEAEFLWIEKRELQWPYKVQDRSKIIVLKLLRKEKTQQQKEELKITCWLDLDKKKTNVSKQEFYFRWVDIWERTKVNIKAVIQQWQVVFYEWPNYKPVWLERAITKRMIKAIYNVIEEEKNWNY